MVVYVTFRPGTIRGQQVGVSFFYYYLGMYDQYFIIRYIYLFTDNHIMIKIPFIQGMYDQYKYFPSYVDKYIAIPNDITHKKPLIFHSYLGMYNK